MATENSPINRQPANGQPTNGRAIMFLEKTCRAFAIGGALVMVALSIVTVVSVLGRYFFNTPVSGDFELVEIGCAIAVAAFLPYCQLQQGNVIVDFFTHNLAKPIKNVLDTIGCLLLTLMAGLISWRILLGAYDLYRYNDQTMILQINTWLAFIIIFPGLVLLTLAGLATAWQAFHGRFGNDDIVAKVTGSDMSGPGT